MHNIRVFSQRSAWAPYMRLHELRSFTHLGVTGPQKWPLSLKKGKSGRQKIKSWYFYCPYVFLKCLQCTFWRNQTVSFSGLSSSLTEAIFRSHMRCATPYWTWRQSQRTEELKSRTRPRTIESQDNFICTSKWPCRLLHILPPQITYVCPNKMKIFHFCGKV